MRVSWALPLLLLPPALLLLPPGPGGEGTRALHPDPPPRAAFEDYRHGVGAVGADGVFRAELQVSTATWTPWGDDGPELHAHVFGAPGQPPRIPGPKLRVEAGTPVVVTLRNTLPDTLLVRGLRDRGQPLPPGAPDGLLAVLPFQGDSVVVGPGETTEVHFTPTVPGDYFYFGKTMEAGWSATPQPLFGARALDRALMGVLLVDAPGEVRDPEERILLLSHWADQDDPGTYLPSVRYLVNGRAWPHTEHLEYALGDTVRWRVINQSGGFHPMHLHGFYFEVTQWTAATGRHLVPMPPEREDPILAVTWPLPPTSAMRMEWVAHEPGNWLFHCHLMRHMSWVQAPDFASPGSHASHAPPGAEGADLLGGMVVGVTVHPPDGWAPRVEPVRRRLALHLTMREGVFGDAPAYAFVLEEGGVPPAPDSVRFPGSLLTLVQGEPTEIVVRNHADVALGVHWHGLELESRSDGVPGWSGMPGETVPAVAPGDSLVVRMTPPRAGTFMYHVHSEPGHQLAQGLYGPLLVLEDAEAGVGAGVRARVGAGARDPDRDRVYLMGALGGGEDAPPALNGRHDPGEEHFRVGERYRLRFMQISPDEGRALRILGPDGEPVRWTPLARDGAPVPSVRRVERPAVEPFVDVGTTVDYWWTPRVAGVHTLEIVTDFDPGLPAFPRPAPPDHVMRVRWVVR